MAPAFTVWVPAAFTGAHDLPRPVTRLDYFLVYANVTRPLAIGVAALVFALRGMVAQPLVLPILRPLEGHGSRGLDSARDRLVARQRRLRGE